MVTEVKYQCSICELTEWAIEMPEECPDCLNPDVLKKETRKRDASDGFCDVGAPEESQVDVNCELVATHEAEIESISEDESHTRNICEKHKRLWEGSDSIIEIREL